MSNLIWTSDNIRMFEETEAGTGYIRTTTVIQPSPSPSITYPELPNIIANLQWTPNKENYYSDNIVLTKNKTKIKNLPQYWLHGIFNVNDGGIIEAKITKNGEIVETYNEKNKIEFFYEINLNEDYGTYIYKVILRNVLNGESSIMIVPTQSIQVEIGPDFDKDSFLNGFIDGITE